MKSQAAELGWLNSKVAESLRRWINLLVDKFALDFVGGQDRPPESLVQDLGNWLNDLFRNIDVSAVLDDLLVYKLGNFSCRIILWTVEFKGLRCGAVILKHLLKSLTDVDCLQEPSEVNGKSRANETYMNGPVSFLHPVGCDQVSYTRKFVEKMIFESEQRRWPYDRSFWENAADNSFTTGLMVKGE